MTDYKELCPTWELGKDVADPDLTTEGAILHVGSDLYPARTKMFHSKLGGAGGCDIHLRLKTIWSSRRIDQEPGMEILELARSLNHWS